MGQGDNLAELLQPCALAFVRHLSAALARIWYLPSGKDVLELQASAGPYSDLVQSQTHLAIGRSTIALIASERKPLVTNRVLGTRMILLSSEDRPGDLAHNRTLQIDAHLPKPVQQEELLDTIYRVIERSPSEPATALTEPARELTSALKPIAPSRHSAGPTGGTGKRPARAGRTAITRGPAQALFAAASVLHDGR